MNDATQSQEAVFALLADPATHGGHAVKRIDTHAASLFLAGERALKVKRAVRFPFLDYLDARQAQGRLRDRARDQPPHRARHLPPRRRDHARGGRAARARRARRAGRMGGRDAPLRREPHARPSRRSGQDRRRARRRARPHGRGVACRCASAPTPRAGSRRSKATSTSMSTPSASARTCFRRRRTERSRDAGRAAFARIRPLLVERGRHGLHPPHPRRPASRQYRAARRPARCCSTPSSSAR